MVDIQSFIADLAVVIDRLDLGYEIAESCSFWDDGIIEKLVDSGVFDSQNRDELLRFQNERKLRSLIHMAANAAMDHYRPAADPWS